jgi:uncharacterized protein YndB with AHSA1/START domain/uncharacterized damage-inducible protein DinB
MDVTPEAVFHALTHPLELSYWFCHYARTEPRAGGDFEVRWRNGWWARGTYQTVERPRRIALTWQGRDEPGETELVFEIDSLDQGTAVKVIHRGYSAEAVWDKAVAEAEQSWPQALDNLESVLTTGIDRREAHRPMLGIVPAAFTMGQAAREEIEAEGGIYLSSVLENGGAAQAGLRTGDVITSIGGMAVADLNSLTTTLAPFGAGERVQVRYVRGRERGTVEVQLKPQQIPDISFDPRQVVEQVRKAQKATLADLRQVVAGLSEEEAEQRPKGGAWSVKETVAHLSVSERDLHSILGDMILGTTVSQSAGNPSAVPEKLAMTLVAAPTVEALLARLEQDMAETLALFAALRPEIIAMKARYRRMASQMLLWPENGMSHVNQIEATIASIQGSG